MDRQFTSASVDQHSEGDGRRPAEIRQLIERKLRSYRGEIDQRKTASLYSSLLRGGFSADIVRRELRALTRQDVPETEAGSA